MSGPADYMRITGPLGGANFLSASEYDAINPGSPGNRVISTMQQGANLAGTVASNKSRELENQAKQIEIDDAVQKKADQEVIVGSMIDARSARTAAPAEAIPMQQPQAATPQIAPQAAPQVAQQAAPAAPAPVAVTPAPQVAQAAPVPAAAPAPQAAASLPPTSAAPAPAAKGPLAQAQDFLARAAETESDYQKDTKFIQDKLGKGELTPRQAQLTLDTLRARRDAETARDTKYAENLDKLQTQFAEGKVTREEARLKLADLNRNQKYDLALMVSDDLAAAGPAQARQTAAENGLNPDEYIDAEGKPTAKLKTDADKSAEAKARAKVLEEKKKADDKVKADEKKANQVKWTFDKDTGLSTGVDPVTGASLIRDENGKAITTADYRALDAKQRSAIAAAGRAPSRGGGGGGSDGAGSAGVNSDGTVSLAKVDKQGNAVIPASTVLELKSVESNARLATTLVPVLERALANADAAPSSGIGRKIADISTAVGMKTESAKARESLTAASDQVISALAAIDPRAKGAPSNSDIEGIKKTLQDPDTEPAIKRLAIERVQGMLKQMQREHQDAFDIIDDNSKALLRAQGVGAPDKQPAKPTQNTPPVIKSQVQYDALPKGTKYVDSAGNIATKK